MTDDWEVFAVFDDVGSAEAVAGRLRSDGVPSEVQRESPVPGLNVFRVVVPTALAHRARWVMSLAETTDAELAYLATGKLDKGA